MESELVRIVRSVGIPFEASESGEWVRFPCGRGATRYIIRSRLADGYEAWCTAREHESRRWFLKAAEALHEIRSGVPVIGATAGDVEFGARRADLSRPRVPVELTAE
ncbi:MAG TPA: hypothetical protein VFF52_04725 [Isosphaeraceae bacterium]|nr:hypothetical protein [Isosphaeraceae bacterium]